MESKDILNKQTEEQFLAQYDINKYKRPSVTVDMLIFTVTEEDNDNYRLLPDKVLKLLLIKRGEHPFQGQWALPGGFVDINENLDEAAYRELKAETNIDHIYMEQLYTYGDVDRDPRMRVISTAYLSLVDSSLLNIQANDDAVDAKWFNVSYKLIDEVRITKENGYIVERRFQLNLNHDNCKLSAMIKQSKQVEGRTKQEKTEIVEVEGIAFDHAKIIAYSIGRLRNKIEYTDIAFHLMPERFTLTQLQQVYETILDTQLLKANFRRKTSGMVIETQDYAENGGHRPSKLFLFNPDWEN